MATISHKIGVATNRSESLAAINSIDGLSKWWTGDTSGDSHVGGLIRFGFGEGELSMKVTTSDENQVRWECIKGPDEWIGTRIEFRLEEEGETAIYFQHKGWKEQSPFHHHCSTKWAVFLLSLKQYLDEGKGRPFPDDQKITTLLN